MGRWRQRMWTLKLFAGLIASRPSACGMAFNKALKDYRACSCPACSQLTRDVPVC